MDIYLLFLNAAELLGEKLVFSRDFNYFILIRSFLFKWTFAVGISKTKCFKNVRYKFHHLSITHRNKEKLYRYSSKGEDPTIITFDFEIDCYIIPKKKDLF